MRDKISGIYCITNNETSKVYIGHSRDIKKRIIHHFCRLRNNVHHCRHLQSAFNKHGECCFTHSIIEECQPDVDVLTIREQFWMDSFTNVGLYNSAPSAKSVAGIKRSDEFREKMSKVHKGKIVSIETRQKLSAALKGRPAPNKGKKKIPEQIAKNSAAHKGHITSLETRAKLSAALKGRVFTDKMRAALLLANTGRPRADKGCKRDPKVGRRISEAKKGRSNGLTGKHLSEEHKQNLRDVWVIKREVSLHGNKSSGNMRM